MNLPSRSQIILSKINEFYRINLFDSDDRVKFALQELFRQWPEVLAAVNDASDDELFALNISRAFLTQIFTIALFKKCFINDHSFTREIFRTCINLLVNHIDIIKSKISISIRIFLISNLCLIMEMSSNIISLLYCTDMDLFNENNYQLLITMREYVNQDFTHDNLTDSILSFIWNVSDNTFLVPLLLKADYAKSLIEWIKICQTKFRQDKQNALIYILQNMARHDDAIEQFNILNTLNIIEHIKIDSSMSFNLFIIRVLLNDTNHIELESIEFFNRLVQLTIDAAGNDDYRYNGSHVCEPLTILTKLFYNDEILHNILCKIQTKPLFNIQSIIELLASLLIKFYPNLSFDNSPLENFTCVLILNIFWNISYHEEYCPIIYNNEELMNIIKSVANNEKEFFDTFMPRTMKNIQQAAIEILKNFDEKN